MKPSPRCLRRGLSLLEVMLSIAILGVSLAVIGEFVRIGTRHAEASRDLTIAQMHCESKLAEIVLMARTQAPQPVSSQPVDDEGDWFYTVEVTPAEQQGLLLVRVTVHEDPAEKPVPLEFSLTRLLIDPATTTTGEGTDTGSGTSASSSMSTGGGSG